MLPNPRPNFKYQAPKLSIEHSPFYRYVLLHEQACRLKNLSASTWRTRDSDLRRFVLWCEERGVMHPSEVTHALIEAYQRYLYTRNRKTYKGEGKLSMVSQHHYVDSVKQFFKWMTKAKHLPSNPASEIELPKLVRPLPTVLTVDEVLNVLHMPNTATPNGIRDRAILEVLYATGIRRSELCHLRLEDVNTQAQTVFVRQGKGKKDRLVPLGEHASRWVETYTVEARPVLMGAEHYTFLFLNDSGEGFKSTALGERVKRHMVGAGIRQAGACHLLRHACATHMLEGGADIRYVQEMLGHADLSSTQVYTHVSIRTLKDVHARTHPLNQARNKQR